MSLTERVELSPKPGFCIKSSITTPGLLLPEQNKNENILEPELQPTPIPQGLKVFVNIAWDLHVPPPPEGSEEDIQRAMKGEDRWYVPVIVTNGRIDADKTGKPSLVFDCVFNSTIKSRTLRDPEFKIFLVELSLQRIEAQSGLGLSRTIGTPNILSKGKLAPRSVLIPKSLFPATSQELPQNQKGNQNELSSPGIAAATISNNVDKKPLIELITDHSSKPTTSSLAAPDKLKDNERSDQSSLPKLRGILKKAQSAQPSAPNSLTSPPPQSSSIDPDIPLDWTWTKEDQTGKLRIDITVPGLSPAQAQSASLDISPRSILLSLPGRKELQLDLTLSDAEITARIANAYRTAISKSSDPSVFHQRKTDETTRALNLKRQRFFDVDAADAEWRIGTGLVRLWV